MATDYGLKQDEVRALFTLAGIAVLDMEALVDGYAHQPSDPYFFEMPPLQVWWFVKTEHGWIKIGWRKRVIHIEWKDTDMRFENFTTDDVTKTPFYVHAWGISKAQEYLSILGEKFRARARVLQVTDSLDDIQAQIDRNLASRR